MTQFHKDQYVKVVKPRETFDYGSTLAAEAGLSKWEKGVIPDQNVSAIVKCVLKGGTIAIEEIPSGRQFVVARVAIEPAPLVFEQDEPVMVVAGGWGLYPQLVGTVVYVNAVSVNQQAHSYWFSLSRPTEKPGLYAPQKAGHSFSGLSIRKLTQDERDTLLGSQTPEDNTDPRIIRARIMELEATIIAAKRETKELREKLAAQGFTLI